MQLMHIYIGICLLLCVAVLFGIYYVDDQIHPLRRIIQLFMGAAVVINIFQCLVFISNSELMADMMLGGYFVSSLVILLILVKYLQWYTRGKKEQPAVRFLALGLVFLDAISFIVNIFTHHVFTSEWTDIQNWGECYVASYDVACWAHDAIAVVFVAVCYYYLIKASMSTARIYRAKYILVLCSFTAVLLGNIICHIADWKLNLSTSLFLFLGLGLCYFTIYYVPKGIVSGLLLEAVDEMNGGIFCFDREGKCVFVNEQGAAGFKRGGEGAVYEDYYKKIVGDSDPEELEELSWQERHQTNNGEMIFDVHFKPMRDDDGRYIGCFFVFNDLTQTIREIEKEHYRATHDDLTGAYNREYFFEKVRELIDRTPGVERCIVCSDIKDFKMVNELFGEEVGDSILKQEEAFLKETVSDDSLYARLSADRFAVCIREDTFDEKVFTRFMDKLTAIGSNSVYRMHIHAGVYKITEPKLDISVMCDRALMAVRSIKDDYERKFAYYDETMGYEKQAEKIILGEFDEALKQGQFQMFLQPQISKEREVLGAEALVRWKHPAKGMIPPIQFIPLFERTGYIHRLDRYVWECACKKLREWKDAGREDLYISVNISPKDFYYINIYETFVELIEKYEISPTSLKLEITETALMTELNKQLGTLSKLRRYGMQIEIDDFGSGYSSLNTLKDIDVDVLKLDIGFISETSHMEKSRIIMNHVISMSRSLGLTIISEGVETEKQLNYLTEAGCDIFQGYFFSRPIPVEEFENEFIKING